VFVYTPLKFEKEKHMIALVDLGLGLCLIAAAALIVICGVKIVQSLKDK